MYSSQSLMAYSCGLLTYGIKHYDLINDCIVKDPEAAETTSTSDDSSDKK
jgi:hypothetical protein